MRTTIVIQRCQQHALGNFALILSLDADNSLKLVAAESALLVKLVICLACMPPWDVHNMFAATLPILLGNVKLALTALTIDVGMIPIIPLFARLLAAVIYVSLLLMKLALSALLVACHVTMLVLVELTLTTTATAQYALR